MRKPKHTYAEEWTSRLLSLQTPVCKVGPREYLHTWPVGRPYTAGGVPWAWTMAMKPSFLAAHLYSSVSPWFCFMSGREASVVWGQVWGRQSTASLHLDSCRPRPCVLPTRRYKKVPAMRMCTHQGPRPASPYWTVRQPGMPRHSTAKPRDHCSHACVMRATIIKAERQTGRNY